MLLISTTYQPATDLGYLLHKNPGRMHTANLTFGKLHVAFSEASDSRATAALLVEIDSVRLSKRKKFAQGAMAQYVNDRGYVASSFTSVAIAEAFGSALNGKCKDRPELAEQEIPLEIEVPVLRSVDGEAWIRRLFEPLGYQVDLEVIPLDENFPDWGTSSYFHLRLTGCLKLQDALKHLYILFPVLDMFKHYFLDDAEVNKLLKKGEGWLENHPEKEGIIKAYLGRRTTLEQEALEQLANSEVALSLDAAESAAVLDGEGDGTVALPPKSLHRQRHERVLELVKALKPESVLDLGCGDGKLLRELIKVAGIERLVGMDVSYYSLERAKRNLNLEDAAPRLRDRVKLIHGSLLYRDDRLSGFAVCTITEVIEHLDPPRLLTFEQVVFGAAAPGTVILTTPNREYNTQYELEGMRHEDHRFEWSRSEFGAWATRVAGVYGYLVEFEGIGDFDETLGAPSQMAVFRR